MAKLTAIKYDLKELCAKVLKISTASFNNRKAHFMKELEKNYIVTIEIGAKNKQFFILEPKQNESLILKDIASDTKLKRDDLQDIELILKAVLIDKVIPVYDEIAKRTGITRSTVARRIAKMKSNEILLEPIKTIVEEVNKYTGEIYKYEQKACSYVYYDILPNGNRIILDFINIHVVFGKSYGNKLQELKYQHRDNYNHNTAKNVASFHAWKEVNSSFDLYDGQKTAKWIVASEYKELIYEKYSC